MASVHAGTKAKTWSFIFYIGMGQPNKSISSGIEVDRSTPRNFERSRKRAEKALALYEKEMEENAPSIVSGKVLFGDFVTKWLEHREGDVKSQSLRSYQYICNKHVVPWFNNKEIYLQELRPSHLQQYIDEKKKVLSISTMKKHKAYIGSALRYARMLELIKFDPMENITLPKQKGSKFVADWYDDNEIREMLKIAKEIDEPIYPAVLLAATKGLRREEACALLWENVNWKRRTISIAQTAIITDGGMKILKMTKTDTSNRLIPLSDSDVMNLKELQRRQELNKQTYGDAYDNTYDGYISIWADGKILHPATVSERWKKFVNRNNLKAIRYQDLRASFATNLLRSGATPERVAKLMGHSDPSTLLKFYARFVDSDLRDIVDNHEKIART